MRTALACLLIASALAGCASDVPSDDADGDGLPTMVEEDLGTDPNMADSDGDGVSDGDEDYDGDGDANAFEVLQGTNPLDPASRTLPADRYEAARLAMENVPCDVPSVGAETTENLKFLANASFGGGVGEIDIRGTLLLSNPGVVDISDPLHPFVVSAFETFEIPSGGDAKWMPDNKSAVVGGGAVRLINLEDPYNPFLEYEWSLEGGVVPVHTLLNAHMLSTARIGGQDWIFLAPNDNTGVWVLRVEGEAPTRTITYVAQTLPIEGGPLGPHDMLVTQDEITGEWWLYAADGFHGWVVFNVDDPANPTPIGGHIRPETGYTHTIAAAKVGNRRIVATIQEVGVNIMEVYDATQILAPILLGTWQVGAGETTPQHNINIANTTLWLAHYTFGFYGFELNDLPEIPLVGVGQLQPVAHYDPVPGGANQPGFGGFGAVWDVVAKDGLLYIGGLGGDVFGVEVIGYGCYQPAHGSATSTG